jgi:hypothetical protein
MPMFTLEIAGKPVAVTDADGEGARELFEADEFREDLLSLESEGRPIWDGVAPFNIRPANDEEMDALEQSLDEADTERVEEDDEDDEDGINVLFLVPVDVERTGLPN